MINVINKLIKLANYYDLNNQYINANKIDNILFRYATNICYANNTLNQNYYNCYIQFGGIVPIEDKINYENVYIIVSVNINDKNIKNIINKSLNNSIKLISTSTNENTNKDTYIFQLIDQNGLESIKQIYNAYFPRVCISLEDKSLLFSKLSSSSFTNARVAFSFTIEVITINKFEIEIIARIGEKYTNKDTIINHLRNLGFSQTYIENYISMKLLISVEENFNENEIKNIIKFYITYNHLLSDKDCKKIIDKIINKLFIYVKFDTFIISSVKIVEHAANYLTQIPKQKKEYTLKYYYNNFVGIKFLLLKINKTDEILQNVLKNKFSNILNKVNDNFNNNEVWLWTINDNCNLILQFLYMILNEPKNVYLENETQIVFINFYDKQSAQNINCVFKIFKSEILEYKYKISLVQTDVDNNNLSVVENYFNNFFCNFGFSEIKFIREQQIPTWYTNNIELINDLLNYNKKLANCYKSLAIFPSNDFLNQHEILTPLIKLPSTENTQKATNYFQYAPHQLAAIEWAMNKNSILLADDMGIGKTFEICGIILHKFFDKIINNNIRILYVCPKSIILQIQDNLRKFFNTTILVTRYSTDNIVKKVPINLKVEIINENLPSEFNILILNYDVFSKKDITNTLLNKYNFDIIVLDEGHRIKTPNAATSENILNNFTQIPCKIISTATPMTNRAYDIWNLLKFLDNDFMELNEFINKFFVERYAFDKKQMVQQLNEQKLFELQVMLRTKYMLRRTIDEIVFDKSIPPLNVIDINVPLSKEYKTKINQYIDNHNKAVAKVQNISQILKDVSNESLLNIIKIIENIDKNIDFTNIKMYLQNNQVKYPIYNITQLQKLTNEALNAFLNVHQLCEQIAQQLENNLKNDIDKDKYIYEFILIVYTQKSIINQYLLSDQYKELIHFKKDKIVEHIKNLIKKDNKSKHLLFVYYKDSGKTLLKLLQEENINAVYIDGSFSLEQREKIKNEYINNPSINVLIGTIGVMAEGIDGLQLVSKDLTFAEFGFSDVKFKQAQARYYRTGLKEANPKIYCFKLSHELEDRLLSILNFKSKELEKLLSFNNIPIVYNIKQEYIDNYLHNFENFIIELFNETTQNTLRSMIEQIRQNKLKFYSLITFLLNIIKKPDEYKTHFDNYKDYQLFINDILYDLPEFVNNNITIAKVKLHRKFYRIAYNLPIKYYKKSYKLNNKFYRNGVYNLCNVN